MAALALFALDAGAETSATASSSMYLAAELETRPSWNSTDGRFFLQNYGELGLLPTKSTSISYQQQFMGQPAGLSGNSTAAPSFRLDDGFLRFRANDLWKDPGRTHTAFSFESRVYLPTEPVKADRGMTTVIRNYFKFTRPITKSASFLFMEVPIVHVYRSAGVGGTNPTANPAFENRLYLEFDWVDTRSGWSLSFPVIFSSTRFRNFQSVAKFNDDWQQWLEIYPELDFALSKSLTLGVAYESDNLLNAQTPSDSAVFSEVGSGTLQFVFRASF